ncbi:MAG: hypothetical protein IPM63_05085 [Acidobacteriota bacterium]|nr:MAG: hypothetical protein IPM63_05085 [Acidobacteriota bacterium]
MPKLSTRNLAALPDIDRLKALLQSLAVLDAIMSPEWDYRYYSFNANWYENEQMGSMRNGCGDEFYAHFTDVGCFLKGFAHEYPMTPYRNNPPELWPGLLEGVPSEFSSGVNEPAFSMENTTVCVWRKYGDESWAHGPIDFPEGEDPDGSAFLFHKLDGDPEKYRFFAEQYYEEVIPIEAVRHIYDHLPLTDEIVASLNPDVRLDELAEDLAAIGYPLTRTGNET